jgi:hypothetical protein
MFGPLDGMTFTSKHSFAHKGIPTSVSRPKKNAKGRMRETIKLTWITLVIRKTWVTLTDITDLDRFVEIVAYRKVAGPHDTWNVWYGVGRQFPSGTEIRA